MLNIRKNVSLKEYATFKIGGLARYFVEVSNEEALLEALEYAKKNNLELFILGGGSNVLFSDDGYNGIVIKIIQNTKYKIQNTKIECWAGDSLASAVKFSAENNLSGLEWAAGIPGTIGGAVRGNAGALGGCMADCIESVKGVKVVEISNSPNYSNLPNKIPNSKSQIPNKVQSPKSEIQNELRITNYELPECNFSYRNSIFKQDRNLIILSCVLKLSESNKSEIDTKMKENIGKRAQKQPKEACAGSFFKNPAVDDQKIIKEFEMDTGIETKDNIIPAGWLINRAELSGKKIGGAMVSEKHNNFIVNTGLATAQDVIILASLIKQQVRNKFGIELQEEVQLVGF